MRADLGVGHTCGVILWEGQPEDEALYRGTGETIRPLRALEYPSQKVREVDSSPDAAATRSTLPLPLLDSN